MLNHQSIDSYSCQGCDIMKNAFECALCSFLCDSEAVFRSHLNAEHKSNFLPCVYCETLYNAAHFLLRHLKSTHSLEAKVYRCGSVECTFKTIVLKKFLSHLEVCTFGKAVRCYHCKSTFTSTNLLILHMQGKLKIVLNKPYPIEKIIRIVPAPVPQSVPILQTHLNITEPKSTILSNFDKTKRTNDVLSMDTVTDQSISNMSTSLVSSPSKRLSYILPKSIVTKPVGEKVRTYSIVVKSRVAPQEVSMTKKISHDESRPHLSQGAVVLPISHSTGNSSTLVSGGNIPKEPFLDVSLSGKHTNVSVCQNVTAAVSTPKPSDAPEFISKTSVLTTNVSPSVALLENVRDFSGDTTKGTKLVPLPLIKLDPTKNVSVKSPIQISQMSHADFLKSSSSSLMSKTDLAVSSEQKTLWQNSPFNKNVCNVAHPKHCIKTPSKIMLIPVPQPPPVYTVLQPEFPKSGTCTPVSIPAAEVCYKSTSMDILSSAKQSSIKAIRPVCTGSISQGSSWSSLSFPSSTLCELDTFSQDNSNCKLNILLESDSKDTTLSSSSNILNSPSIQLEVPLHKNPFKVGSVSPAADGNSTDKMTLCSTVCSPCAPETLTCTSNPLFLSSAVCHFRRTDHSFKPKALPCHASSVTPVFGNDTALPELGAEFSAKSKVSNQAKVSCLEKSFGCENILSLKPVGVSNNLNTCSPYSEDSSNKLNCEAILTTSNRLTSAGKQNSSVSTIPEICLSSTGLQTPIVSPVTTTTKMKQIALFSSDTSKISSIPTLPTFVTYVKQEAISSCDLQRERAMPSFTVKSEVAPHEKISDRFSDYYGDIAAVVSSHSLLSQRDSSAAISAAASGNLMPVAQNFHPSAVFHNGSSSDCTSTPVLLPVVKAVKGEPQSRHFSCIGTSKTSSVSTSSDFVTSIKQEVASDYELPYKTPPISPVANTVAPVSNSFSGKSHISSYNHVPETVSSAVNETSVSFSREVNSSHNKGFTSPCIFSFCKEKYTATASRNANCSAFACTSNVPVGNQCMKSVSAFSVSPPSHILTTSSDTNSSSAVYKGTKSMTSSLLSYLDGPAVLVNRNAVCDVTFTTLDIKPKISLNSSLPRTVPSSMMNIKNGNENSICELAQCAPVTCQSQTMIGNELCGISAAHHSAKICPNFVPVKLVVAPPAAECTANKNSFEAQCGGLVGTVMGFGINDKAYSAGDVSQISTVSNISICDSQHLPLKHSTYSSVASFCEITSKDQSVCTAAYDSSHTHIGTLKNNIPHPSSCNITYTVLSTAPVLLETAEKSISECSWDSTTLCSTSEESNSSPCANSSSEMVDDRHPFLNSTNMTVRQILEKFRGKCKSNVNTSRKDSLRTYSKSVKTRFAKQHIQCSTDSQKSLLSPASAAVASSANETFLKPSASNQISHPSADVELMAREDTSVVSCKRKIDLDLDITVENSPVENSTVKVQKIDQQVMSVLDNTEEDSFVHFPSEHSIKSEVLPSYVNEQSISRDALIFDQYYFSQLENKTLINVHSTEDMCAGTDILQVARELLYYNEAPGELTDEFTDTLQALKQKKSEKALKEVLQPLKLKDFFKCMIRHCSYTSNICAEFSKHLKEHDVLLYGCAYCLVDFPASDNLICHLMQEHKKSLFQCSLCFYRAYSQTQVCIHFRKFHSCEKGHIIACSPVDTYPVSSFKENHMVYYADIAKPFNCCFYDCSFSCIAILDVIHHILYYHPVCSSYVCKECKNQHLDIFDWLIHCQLHGIHLFHCIYCAFGAETRTDMLYHISMYHANESLFVFVRSSRYPMSHLEHILKHKKKANVKNLCDFSDSLLINDKCEVDIQLVLENTINISRTLKCLYCLCSAECAPEMQNHLYSKHTQNDMLHYCFCQSQFQTISEADFIFESLLSSNLSNKQSTICTDMILLKSSLCSAASQTNVPSQITFLETSNGVVNLQLPLAVCKQNNFKGKYKRILRSLYNQIQSRIQSKRFKCLYCKKTEMYLFKLRQHWRCCHVQTGKKFKYELINKKKYEVSKSSCETCANVKRTQNLNSNASHDYNFSPCQFCVCNHKTNENVINTQHSLDASGQLHFSHCYGSLKMMDSFSVHEKSDNGGYWNQCCNCCNFLPSTKVPSKGECSFHKCNCMFKAGSHTVCQMPKLCCAEITGSQMCAHDAQNRVQKLRNHHSGRPKSHSVIPSCYCLMKCSKKSRCLKKLQSSRTEKHYRYTNDVKLKVFLRKLPYSVKLPVLYLKRIINLEPVVVLSDIKYENRMM